METIPIGKNVIKNLSKIGLKPNEFTLFCLITYFNTDSREMPTQDELGEMIGLSERQIKQIIADLKRKGFLIVNRKKSITYDFSPLLNMANHLELLA